MNFGRGIQDSVVRAVSSLFAHGPMPLADTLNYAGEPGLLGPDSVSWRILGDSSVFVGGIRALVVQSAHPEVAAGVEDHSTYREDPLGRLSRTAVYVTETTYGAIPEVEAAVAVVREAHRPITGTSERGCPYQRQLGLSESRWAGKVGRSSVGSMRWALGASPSWQIALTRCNRPIPPGIFKQPLPTKDAQHD